MKDDDDGGDDDYRRDNDYTGNGDDGITHNSPTSSFPPSSIHY